jgi:hypothetical protein
VLRNQFLAVKQFRSGAAFPCCPPVFFYLHAPLRASESDELLHTAIESAVARKPKGHDFVIDRRHTGPALPRHMSVTGG